MAGARPLVPMVIVPVAPCVALAGAVTVMLPAAAVPRYHWCRLNGDVVPRATYDAVCLHDGDRVEIVRMVGGG